jgi:6-pyruvoyltetrahydropterin/6-carboxytetrahydropterin synthase
VILYKQFSFDSAHLLPNVPEGHKCRELHGHTYHLTIFLEGEVDEERGWVMDFTDLKKAVKPVIDRVDHKYLNDIPGLENPTTEVFSMWLWEQIKPLLPQLKRIELKETPTSGVIYEGE